MSCSAPTEVSQVYRRAARCARWSARASLLGSVLVAFVAFKSAQSGCPALAGEAAPAPRLIGQLTAFVALFTLQVSLFLLALRRFSAARHASVKANQLEAVELLLTKAGDESVRKELTLRLADLSAGKPGCCK
jgi:hypothetical protein